MPEKRKPPEICPNCGAIVPENALACPECGSDYETGWSERAYAQHLGLPDDEFNYDEFIKEEFGDNKNRNTRRLSLLWIFTALLLIFIFIYIFVLRL